MIVDPKIPEEPITWPSPVVRVGLRWDGATWSTTDLVRVPSMTLPRADGGDPQRMSGFWVDTLDDKGNLRYRQRMTDPLLGMEQFSETGEITRLTHGEHAIDIEALVPDDVPAAAVRLTRRTEEDEESSSMELPVDREGIRAYDEQPRLDERHEERHGGHDDERQG